MASSSSSQTRTQQTLVRKPNSSSLKVSSLLKRQETVFKKAYELSTLCGIEVCVIYYGPDGVLKTWPEDREKVKDMARRYSALSEIKRRKGRVDLAGFLKKIEEDESTRKNTNKKRKVRLGSCSKYQDWDPNFEHYSVEQLTDLMKSLEHNLTRIQHRFQAVVEAQKQRSMQNMIMADQEQRMMTSTTTMNPLQHHPNQVSMILVNHGSGTFSRIPFPASGFNPAQVQSQSLAPLPAPLTTYPNSTVENYSGLLGGQETSINRLQSMNMLPYSNNNIYQNGKGEDYSGLLGTQGTGMSEFQNTNLYNYNNINVEDNSGMNELPNTNIYGYQGWAHLI